jgi:hypothetical protein
MPTLLPNLTPLLSPSSTWRDKSKRNVALKTSLLKNFCLAEHHWLAPVVLVTREDGNSKSAWANSTLCEKYPIQNKTKEPVVA